jgi:diaminopimelate decarboxylase
MTSPTNTPPPAPAAEIMVDGDQVHVIRQRENPADLFALETMLK